MYMCKIYMWDGNQINNQQSLQLLFENTLKPCWISLTAECLKMLLKEHLLILPVYI